MRQRHVLGLGLLSLVALTGSALGQEAPARQEKQPLQGPTVKETRAPHTDEQMTDGKAPGRMGPQIPMRAYSDVIGKLRGEQAPADLRLSDEQEQKLGAIEQEFREASRAYAQQQREQRGDQPLRPGAGSPNGQPRRERLQEAMRNGPRPSDYQTRIWAVLNEKQQAHVKDELDKIREDLQKRRSEESMQRRLEQRKPGEAGQPARPTAGTPDGDGRPLRERAARLMRRLAQLPEEERNALISRLEAELDRRGVPDGAETDKPEKK